MKNAYEFMIITLNQKSLRKLQKGIISKIITSVETGWDLGWFN